MSNGNNHQGGNVHDMIDKAGEKAKEGIDKAKNGAQKEMTALKQTVDKAVRQTEEYIKKNPEKATAIAAGVGAALGAAMTILLGKRRR